MIETLDEIFVVIILVIGVMFLTIMLCTFYNNRAEKPKYMTLPEPSFEMPKPEAPPKLSYQVIDQEAEDEVRLENYYRSLEP